MSAHPFMIATDAAVRSHEVLAWLVYLGVGFFVVAIVAAALGWVFRSLRGRPELVPPTCRRCRHVVGSDADPNPRRCAECGRGLDRTDRVMRVRYPRTGRAALLGFLLGTVILGFFLVAFVSAGERLVEAIEASRRHQIVQEWTQSPSYLQPKEASRPPIVEWSPWLAAAMPPPGLVAMTSEWHLRTMAFGDTADNRRARAGFMLHLLVAAVERGDLSAHVSIPAEDVLVARGGSVRVELSDAVSSVLAEGVAHGLLDQQRTSEAILALLLERKTPSVSLPTRVMPASLATVAVTRRDHAVHGWCAIDEVLLDGHPVEHVADDRRPDRPLVAFRAPAEAGAYVLTVRWRTGIALPSDEHRWEFALPRGVDASARSVAVVAGETKTTLQAVDEPETLPRITADSREPLRAGFGRMRFSIAGGGMRSAALIGMPSRSTLAWNGDLEMEADGRWIPLLTLAPLDGPQPMRTCMVPLGRHEFGDVVRIRYVPRNAESTMPTAPVAADGVLAPWQIEMRAASGVWARPTIYTLQRSSPSSGLFYGEDDCGKVLHE